MKRRLLGAIALIAFAAEAGAADLPLKTPSAYAPYDWSGFYVGAHVGWEKADTSGFTNNNATFSFAQTPIFVLVDNGPADQTMRGWLAGGQLGYNHQFGRAVLGVEFSGSWSHLNGQSGATVPGALTNIPVDLFTTPMSLGCAQLVDIRAVPAGTDTTTLSCNARVDWTVHAVTRLGYTFGDGRFLPYIEAGATLAHLRIDTFINYINTAPNFTLTQTDAFGKSKELAGVVLGGGAQYALGQGFSLGIEYLFAKYPSQDLSSIGTLRCISPTNSCTGGASISNSLTVLHTVQENRDLTTNTVRVVLNYKFTD
jgi:opacity protein-like surface antigen